MTAVPEAAAGRSIVDDLIEERAPSLTGRRWTARLLRRLIYPMLRYTEALHFARLIERLDGPDVLDLAADELKLELRIDGLERIPSRGRAILVANHPTGIADGIAVWSALRARRADLIFLANADALRVAPRLDSHVIPVDWVPQRRSHAGSRETIRGSAKALLSERLLVTFPAGRLARLGWRGLQERPWLPSVLNLARRFDAPLLPLTIRARNSALFYAFSQVSSELRDITLFNELLNKRGQRFDLRIGPAIDPAHLPDDMGAAIRLLQRLVERGHGTLPRPPQSRDPRRPLAGAPA